MIETFTVLGQAHRRNNIRIQAVACTESRLSGRPRNFSGLFVHKPPLKNFFLHIFVSVINKSVEENFFVIVFFLQKLCLDSKQ